MTTFVVEFQPEEEFVSNFEQVTEVGHIVPYEGQYSFTPTDETQIISTQGLTLGEDIEIKPIPSDYAHVAWNGSILRFF